MSRRPAGSGSVRELPPLEVDGQPVRRFQLRWKEAGKDQSKVIRGGSEEEAERRLDNIVALLDEAGMSYSSPTVRAYGDRFLIRLRKVGFKSIGIKQSRWDAHITGAPFIDIPIGEVGPSDLKQFMEALEDKGLGVQMIRHCIFDLSAIFRDAVEREVIDSNPVGKVRKPSLPETRCKVVLSFDEIVALERDHGDDPLAWWALFMCGAGTRPGESLGLRLDEIEMHGSAPHMNIVRSNRKTTYTKTGRRRRVELTALALHALEVWLERFRPYLRVKRMKDVQKSPWVFPFPEGWLRERGPYGELMAALGRPDMHPHDLRGTCATHLLSGSYGHAWDIAHVAAHLGDSVETTRRSYAHVTATAQRDAADRTEWNPDGIGGGVSAANSSRIPVARPVRFERTTPSFVGLCSIQLSYGRFLPKQVRGSYRGVGASVKTPDHRVEERLEDKKKTGGYRPPAPPVM